MELTWARFVLEMRKRGVTTLLHEVNTYDNPRLPMQIYAEMKGGRLIGVYNPRSERGRVLSKASAIWSKRGREFSKIKI